MSRGPPPVVIPDVAGQPEEQATLTLAGAGFAVDPRHDFDENVPAGIAIRTDPAANEKHAPESTIALVVSDGAIEKHVGSAPVPDVLLPPVDATVTRDEYDERLVDYLAEWLVAEHLRRLESARREDDAGRLENQNA